jgi:hypothetical protein
MDKSEGLEAISIGQRPVKQTIYENQALQGRKHERIIIGLWQRWGFKTFGLASVRAFIFTGRCPVLMLKVLWTFPV